jgi:glutamate formiminotransferase/formiminotetrahydrofolate cyclodeaminase
MHLPNIQLTPVHIAFDEVCRSAAERGLRVTGSELVGLIPLQAMLDAGKYFFQKQQRSIGVSEKELIRMAVLSMGLDELAPFHPEERIIEYLLRDKAESRLVQMSLADFADETASESPAPGGGSISAYVGALGASLGTMVANLSSHKKGWDARWSEFGDWATKGQQAKDELLKWVDADTRAFDQIMQAFALPQATPAESAARSSAIQAATKEAMAVPLRVMQSAYASMELIRAMAETGNPNSVSDAGVGALCARTAVMGAYMNVRINAAGCEDREFAASTLAKGREIENKAIAMETEILRVVNEKIGV